MAEVVLYVRASRQSVIQAISSIPEIVSGNVSGHSSANRRMMTEVGKAALAHIHAAFLIKASGGTDEAGDRWEPLARSTMNRRVLKFRTRAEKKRPGYPSQGFTKRQQERWWDVYKTTLRTNKGDQRDASRRAYATLASEGAQTLFDKYASRVEILKDTGLLVNSLAPEPTGRGKGVQVFRTEPGKVTFGSCRKGVLTHHYGNPERNIRQRRLWAPPYLWPSNWWADILRKAEDGIVQIVTAVISRL